ncbi:MAG: carbohydrate porin [Alphaproteobacteria bacterium]|nr:carbohydrate porin [Alphaproteobacteria bacterium]
MNNKIYTLMLPLVTLLLSCPIRAQADEVPEELKDYSAYLTGDWGGARRNLENRGIATDIIYKFDVVGNVSGGIKRGIRALDNLDVIFTLDGEKILGIKGLSAKVNLLNNMGSRPDNDLVGSSQGLNNIEVPSPTAKLYQAYLEQTLLENQVSLLAGLYDLNSEFYVTDSSALFIHSTFGIGTEMSQSGQNGPSIFPNTSVGTRVRLNPTKNIYIQTAILDGVSGAVNHPHGTHIRLDNNDGWLLAGETGYTQQGATIAVGGWYYTEKSDHLALTGDKEHNNGSYIIGEKQLYQESNDQGLVGFVRFGIANGDVNEISYAWSAGFVYTGFLPGHDEGQLGFGITGAQPSSEYKKAALVSEGTIANAETTFELTYSDKITPWLLLQPDIQYVINPGINKELENALVLSTRFTIDF